MSVKTLLVFAFLSLFVLLLSGCTAKNTKQILGSAVANVADTKVGYDKPSCYVVQQQCRDGYYQEWETSDGVPGCSCKL